MNNYVFETINECKQYVKMAGIEMDIEYGKVVNIFKIVSYFCNLAYITVVFGVCMVKLFNIVDINIAWGLVIILAYALVALIYKFVKDRAATLYSDMKVNMCRNMAESCKELAESDLDEYDKLAKVAEIMRCANIKCEIKKAGEWHNVE